MPATSPLLPLLLLLLAAAAGAPVRYDQRQEGDFNVHAHLENFVIVLIPSSGSGGGGGLGIVDFLKKAGASVRTSEQPLQVAVVGVTPKDQLQSKEDPQLQSQQQQERVGEEDLQAEGTQPVQAVLVAESPALLLARADIGQQAEVPGDEPVAVVRTSSPREGKAMDGGAGGCPQGQFRDATGVCHYIGSDRRIDEQLYFGLEAPLED